MTRRAVILVEGESDRVALETLAARGGDDLAAQGVAVISMTGVTNARAYLVRFAASPRLAVLCDDREAAGVVLKR